MHNLFDSHIHLDMYTNKQLEIIQKELETSSAIKMVSVSNHLASCQRNLTLSQTFEHSVYPAFGFHPEQELPKQECSLSELFDWIKKHKEHMVAVGEVGLPYFMKLTKRKRGIKLDYIPYLEILEEFILIAKRNHLPIVLHAVQEDAAMACDLLEKHSYTKAHFHWYKGPQTTTERMKENGYYISFPPEVCYDAEAQTSIQSYPLHLLMSETDGPWPFEGPFSGKLTTPSMMHKAIYQAASIKRVQMDEMYETLYENAMRFFSISN